MKKTVIALLMLSIVALLPVAAQSASEVSLILEKKASNTLDFSYLVASSAGFQGNPFQAYAWCDRFNTFPLDGTMNDPATPKAVSHFLMTNYQLPGGIMWTLTGKPRYAYKELKHRGLWPQGTDPDTALSGRDLIRAIRQFLADYPDALPRKPDAPEPDPSWLKALLSGQEASK